MSLRAVLEQDGSTALTSMEGMLPLQATQLALPLKPASEARMSYPRQAQCVSMM